MWRFPSLTETWIERAEQVLNDSSSVFLTDEDLLDEINEWLDEKYQFSQRTFQRYKSWETTWQDYEKDLFDSFRHLYKKALRREKKNLFVKFQSDEWQWQKWAWIIERKFDEWNIRMKSEVDTNLKGELNIATLLWQIQDKN